MNKFLLELSYNIHADTFTLYAYLMFLTDYFSCFVLSVAEGNVNEFRY